MPELPFVKMQALGNDFIVVSAMRLPPTDWPYAACVACRRRFGVGSDGLMVVERSPDGGFLTRMFDPDGHEDFCGNGTRCAAVFLHQEGYVEQDAFDLDTLWGRLGVRLHLQDGRAVGATVDMGRAEFDPAKLPSTFPGDTVLQRKLEVDGRTFVISAVSTGTTHTVIFCRELPDDATFLAWSPRIETHTAFLDGTSVLWTALASPDLARVRIWERGGVGESLACGTGACAVAAVAQRLGIGSDRLTVSSKGGDLQVALDARLRAMLTGPAERVFAGRMRWIWRNDRRGDTC